MQWGLVPWFSKDGNTTYSTINARAEGGGFQSPEYKGHIGLF